MQDQKLSFEELPGAVSTLLDEVKSIKQILTDENVFQNDDPVWFNVAQLRDYLPGHPSRQTVYYWASHKLIPYHKQSRNLSFLKTEIDHWLSSAAQPTDRTVMEEARQYTRENPGCNNDSPDLKKFFSDNSK